MNKGTKKQINTIKSEINTLNQEIRVIRKSGIFDEEKLENIEERRTALYELFSLLEKDEYTKLAKDNKELKALRETTINNLFTFFRWSGYEFAGLPRIGN